MLSNTCKYALRALIYLAKFSKEDKMIGIKKISEDLKLSSPFLGKILHVITPSIVTEMEKSRSSHV